MPATLSKTDRAGRPFEREIVADRISAGSDEESDQSD